MFSSPFIEERLYFKDEKTFDLETGKFSSPFIEERLYLLMLTNLFKRLIVLVPFYRGAVVFAEYEIKELLDSNVLVPFYRGAVVFETVANAINLKATFSSPFIEERLYFLTL